MATHVFHLIGTKGFFGAENVLLEICRQLKGRGRFSPVVGLFDNGGSGHLPLLERCRDCDIETRLFPCRGQFDWACINMMRRYISEYRPAIIHSHGYKSNFYAFLTRQSGVSLVSTCHNWIPGGLKMGLYTGLDKVILRWFDRVVAVSERIEETLLKVRIRKSRITVIHNGIDTTLFHPDEVARGKVRKDLGIPEGAIVIGWVGRMTPEKGLYILIESARSILADFPDVHLLLVGDGPLRQSLEEYSPSARIKFAGLRKDVAACYAAFDIFVLPSLNEGLPMVVLEAMATGIPVVASKVGAIPMVIAHGKTGYLVDPGRPEHIASALRKLLEDRQEAKKMGSNGREQVAKSFSSAIMAEKYEDLYRQVIAGQTV